MKPNQIWLMVCDNSLTVGKLKFERKVRFRFQLSHNSSKLKINFSFLPGYIIFSSSTGTHKKAGFQFPAFMISERSLACPKMMQKLLYGDFQFFNVITRIINSWFVEIIDLVVGFPLQTSIRFTYWISKRTLLPAVQPSQWVQQAIKKINIIYS